MNLTVTFWWTLKKLINKKWKWQSLVSFGERGGEQLPWGYTVIHTYTGRVNKSTRIDKDRRNRQRLRQNIHTQIHINYSAYLQLTYTQQQVWSLYLKTKSGIGVIHSSLKIYTSLVVSSVRSRSLESNAQQWLMLRSQASWRTSGDVGFKIRQMVVVAFQWLFFVSFVSCLSCIYDAVVKE